VQTECQVFENPQTKPAELGCESACLFLLLSTPTVVIYYYYTACKVILVLLSLEGWKAKLTMALQ